MSNNKKLVVDIPTKKEEVKMDSILYIGNGAAGNKAVSRALERNIIDINDALLINSTSKDFPEEYIAAGGNTIILSNDDGGSGKERNTSYQYMSAAIRSGIIEKAVEGHTNIVIVTSIEGGTGSGSTPLLSQYCTKVLGKNVRIYCFAGFEEDSRGLENSVGFFQEIDRDSTLHCVRNSLFKAGNKFAAERAANDEFCDHIEILTGKTMVASSQNMDNKEMEKIRNTIGYCVVNKVEFDNTLMDQDDFNKLCKQLIVHSKSLQSEYGQSRMGVILNIKPESEDAVDFDFTVLKDTYGEPYEYFTHRQYDGGKQYIAVINAGMKLPLDEVKGIYQRYQEQSAKVDKERDNFFDEISNMRRADEDSRFDAGMGGNRKPTMSKDDFLKSLMGNVERK